MYVTADQLIPGHNSKAEEWIAWYELIPGGKATANPIWLKAWSLWGGGAANTVALRDYMRKNAGIEISTNGIGTIIDGALGVADSVQSVFMVPVYALAIGGVVALGVSGFLFYKAYQNPERAVELTKMMAFEKGGGLGLLDNKKHAYTVAGVSILVIALISLLYVRHNNQKVITNILSTLNKTPDPILGSGGGKYGDTRDLGLSKIFTTSFWKTNPNKVTIWAKNANNTDGPAFNLARQIWEAKSTSDLSRLQFRDYPERVVAAFKQLKSKEDVSKLADVFEGRYKTNLFNFINDSFMTGNCSPDQDNCYLGLGTNYLKQVHDWITTQLN